MIHDPPKSCESHNFTVLGVVMVIGAGALIGLVGILILAYQAKGIPGEVIALVSGCFGAMPSLLAQTRSQSETGTQDVKVINEPKDAVPVDTDLPK